MRFVSCRIARLPAKGHTSMCFLSVSAELPLLKLIEQGIITSLKCFSLSRHFFVRKCRLLFTSATYIQVHFRLDVFMEVYNINPDQTAPYQSDLGPYCLKHPCAKPGIFARGVQAQRFFFFLFFLDLNRGSKR